MNTDPLAFAQMLSRGWEQGAVDGLESAAESFEDLAEEFGPQTFTNAEVAALLRGLRTSQFPNLTPTGPRS